IPSTTGYPGVGGNFTYRSWPTGGVWQSIFVGHHDTVAPNAVSSTPVGSSVQSNSVSLQWPATTDDSIGIGIQGYQITRGGTVIGYSASTEFGDSTAAPSTTYTYGIAAEDQHGNIGTATTLSVTTPPAGSPDPRRTGVRGTGSYWGGGGEQIDTLSGNLN